jgi:hypothetical protein
MSFFKQSSLTAAAVIGLSLAASPSAMAGSVSYSDPVPAGDTYPGCAIPVEDGGLGGPTGNDGGISYEWTVKLGKHDKASFVNHVGAKSFNEPPPAYEPPETGWTHTSNWVALELLKRGNVEIKVERQEGVPFASNGATATARNMLVPAIAVYEGWDDTSCEDHRYNTSGNVDWSTLQFIGNELNEKGKPVAVYRGYLKAGRYSIAIGGTPKVLASYPANDCNALDPICYAYTGRHGYRAEIKTYP